MTPEMRRFALWRPGYAGAPPAVGPYYMATLACAVAALTLRFLPGQVNAAMLPFQFSTVVLRLYRPIVRRRTLPLRDLPAASTQYAVRIGLSRNDAYGSDEGLASFVDGWLFFQGEGCAFSVRSCDVKAAASATTLTFDGPCRPHTLTFDHAEPGFLEAWKAWRAETPPPTGITIFPPTVPVAARRGWDHAVTATLLGAVAFGLLGKAVVWSWIALATGAVLLLIVRLRHVRAKALARIALGKPPRRSAWTILGANIHLERLGTAFRADRRRRKRRRALTRDVSPSFSRRA